MTQTPSADVISAARARSDEIDSWLRALLRDPGKGIALLAVGSLGRREPCPQSDLDLVIVHEKRRKDVRQIAEAVWYPIWDSGQRLDHSVRTLDEALAVASADLKVGLGLLEGRFIAGDEALATQLLGKWADRWRQGARRWLPLLAESVASRQAEAGDVAFDLHPDLKDGRGGLRDIEAMRAAAAGWDGVASIAADRSIIDAHRRLLTIRVALHDTAGRTDHLTLQDQDGVARALGMVSADALLSDVATAARRVAWVSDDVWRRVRDWKRGPTSRRSTADRAVGPGIVVRDEEVHLDGIADPAADPTLALRAAAAAGTSGLPLSRSALDRLAASPPLPTPWPATARSALVSILGSGHAVALLEALDQVGALARVLPEWKTVRSRPQRNAYHRWTVDRHLCEAANGAAALTRRVDRPDLLLIGTWLHDLGKGVPGQDHTEAGIHLMRSIGSRMGFPPEDVHVLVELVRLHLLLPDVATRRDVTDPATVGRVAAEVGDERTLRLLWALTEADSQATGPAAWSKWKAALVAELVERVSALLAEQPAPPTTPSVVPGLLPKPGQPGGVALSAPGTDGDGRLVIAGPDRPGFLATVAGVLAVSGLDVISADVGRDEGVAFQAWTVEPSAGRWPDWKRLEDDLQAAVEGRFALSERLAQRLRAYEPVRRRRQAAPAPPHVSVDSHSATAATVIEVRAGDGVGLLHRVASALTSCGLDIRSARVQTLGHEVVDTFYVVTIDGKKVDRAMEATIVQAVFAAV